MVHPSENFWALCLVQALLGQISPNFRAVSLSAGEGARLRFLLEQESDEDREAIDDIVAEFEALLPGRADFDKVVEVDNRPLDASHVTGRLVYLRRESS